MRVSCLYYIVVCLLAVVMFSRSERGLKRKANGKLRGSRQQLLRELRPSWWADVCMRKSDARMRKSLGNLLALDSASSDWVDEV